MTDPYTINYHYDVGQDDDDRVWTAAEIKAWVKANRDAGQTLTVGILTGATLVGEIHTRTTDAFGNVEEVKGPGVVGETPKLEVGQSFNYTSFCPLKTPVGSMQGSYQMVDNQGEHFEAPIPAFALAREEEVN